MCWNGPAVWEECGHEKIFFKYRHEPLCAGPIEWRDYDQKTTFEKSVCGDCKQQKKEQKAKEKEEREKEQRERKEKEKKVKDENRKNKLDEWKKKHGVKGEYHQVGGSRYYY